MWEQLPRLYRSLSRAQLILIGITALTFVGGFAWFLHYSEEKDYKPLFTGLSAEDANQVVTKLKEAKLEYRLGDNGSSVLVRSSRIPDARLFVAGAGLPKSGRIGFELFDKTNFGATDFSEQINYRRALEGELERSVMSIVEVEHARVHLTFPKDSIFVEQRQPAKASVLLKLRPEASLSAKNITAIGHLVASAVEGLKPNAVTVVDMNGNLLNKPALSEEDERRYTPLDYKEKVERDLLAKVNTTLSAVIGPDHFRAGVTAEVDFSKGEQSEETWDPTRSVMVSQQRTEESAGGALSSGVPGTQSNLPRPPSRPGSRDGGLVRRTENTTYQSSRLVRRTSLPEGNVKRLTVSAVIDQTVRWEGAGAKAKRILEPPSEETLTKVRDLVAAAVGFDEKRGDQIVVQSLPFESTLRTATPPAEPVVKPPTGQSNPTGLEKWLAEKNIKVSPSILLGAAAAVALALIGAIVFFLRKRRKSQPGDSKVVGHGDLATQGELSSGESPARSTSRLPAVAHGAGPPGVPQNAEEEARRLAAERELLSSLNLPELTTKKSEVLIRHISEQARRDSIGIANLIRAWLLEKEI